MNRTILEGNLKPTEPVFTFNAQIELIGINPYVTVPEEILKQIFICAGKDKSPIPIKGTVNKRPYLQTLVRYKGSWRLYINTSMLENSPGRIGEKIDVSIAFDPANRSIQVHPQLTAALLENKKAADAFKRLPPSLQKEIIRFIASLKSDASIENNVKKAINFLLGRGRFIGRDPKPFI